MKLSLLLLVGVFFVVFYDVTVESAALQTAESDNDNTESGASPEEDGLHEIVKRQVRRQSRRQNRRQSRRPIRRRSRNPRGRTSFRRLRFGSDSRDDSRFDSRDSDERYYNRRGGGRFYDSYSDESYYSD